MGPNNRVYKVGIQRWAPYSNTTERFVLVGDVGCRRPEVVCGYGQLLVLDESLSVQLVSS